MREPHIQQIVQNYTGCPKNTDISARDKNSFKYFFKYNPLYMYIFPSALQGSIRAQNSVLKQRILDFPRSLAWHWVMRHLLQEGNGEIRVPVPYFTKLISYFQGVALLCKVEVMLAVKWDLMLKLIRMRWIVISSPVITC